MNSLEFTAFLQQLLSEAYAYDIPVVDLEMLSPSSDLVPFNVFPYFDCLLCVIWNAPLTECPAPLPEKNPGSTPDIKGP